MRRPSTSATDVELLEGTAVEIRESVRGLTSGVPRAAHRRGIVENVRQREVPAPASAAVWRGVEEWAADAEGRHHADLHKAYSNSVTMPSTRWCKWSVF